MTLALRRAYPSRFGPPVITHVDPEIFRLRYFTYCSACGFCFDACCRHGVDVDADNVERLMRHAARLEGYVGRPAGEWFTGRYALDPEFPGGRYTRTAVQDGGCVFLNRAGRGCLLHAYCDAQGIDYHELKPLVSVLFPLTFADGVLCAATEVEDGTLVCAGSGPTLYEALRGELVYYFGTAFAAELDEVVSTR